MGFKVKDALGYASGGLFGETSHTRDLDRRFEWAQGEYQDLKAALLSDPSLLGLQRYSQLPFMEIFRTTGQREADYATGALRNALASRGGGAIGPAYQQASQARQGVMSKSVTQGMHQQQAALQAALQSKWSYLLGLVQPMFGVTSSNIQAHSQLGAAQTQGVATLASSLASK